MPNSPFSLNVEQVRCTLKDVLRLAEQVPYDRSSVVLSDSPGTEYYGVHKDWYVQLSIRVMIGNGITWALMITILMSPTRDGHSMRKKHTVRKFKVPYSWAGLEALRFRRAGFSLLVCQVVLPNSEYAGSTLHGDLQPTQQASV